MQKYPPGLYWYNGDAAWGEKCLQLEINDKNQWRHTIMISNSKHWLPKLPTAWYERADSALFVGKYRGQWTRVEPEDPHMETDF